MKSDLDRLMAQRGLDAIIIHGADGLSRHSAAWNYLTRGQDLHGNIIKLRDRPAMILFHPMEIQQATATGLELVSMGRWDLKAIAKGAPTRIAAAVEMWRTICTDLGIRGRVGFYGADEASRFLALIDALREALPGISIVGEFDNSLIDAARRTKDAQEIAALEDCGRRACAVVSAVVEKLSALRPQDGLALDPATGRPLTIGEMKTFIARACEQHELEQEGDNIFAQGRDAGIPHARGKRDEPLRLGQAIIFDFFPRCTRTGYFHDMTRTFALGHAPDDLLALHADVKFAFDEVMRALAVDTPTKRYHDQTCAVFSERGHKTIADHWPLEEGYCHSLGHGLGLEVHEAPSLGGFVDRGDRLERGSVVTVEPGLYYPQRGMGVRIEDTVVVDENGTVRSITPFAYDLVIPLAEK